MSKTGYISEAGHCLVMQAQIVDRPMIIVLLNAHGKYSGIGDANRIKKWLEGTGYGRFDNANAGRESFAQRGRQVILPDVCRAGYTRQVLRSNTKQALKVCLRHTWRV